MVLILWGIASAFLLASLWAGRAARQRLAKAGGWPTARGRIIDAGVESRGNGTFAPRVSYAYSVAGRGYASDRLRPGGTPFYYSEAKAWAAAGAYGPGTDVTVYHDPRKPARAAIELVQLSHAILLFRILAVTVFAIALLVTVV